MVCYIVPLTAAIACLAIRRSSRMDGVQFFWLNIMLAGGAIFGVIDHLWNGEIFMISANWAMDLALGGTITGGITTAWGFMAHWPRISGSFRQVFHHLGFMK